MRTLQAARLRAQQLVEQNGQPPRTPDELLSWATKIVCAEDSNWTVQTKTDLAADGLIIGNDRAINIHNKLREDIALFRFTVLHELGHFCLHPRLRQLATSTRDALSKFRAEDPANRQSRFDWEETDADAFAAEALCPAHKLIEDWENEPLCSIQSLAERLAAPAAAIRHQLKRALEDECMGNEPPAAATSMLSDEQRHAAQQPVDQMTYVNAGPGTGKTTTVIERVRWLVNDRAVAPDEVTVVSFSNSAVRTFRHRLHQTNDPRLSSVRVSTVHSLALEILRTERGDDTPVPRVIDDLAYLQRLRDVLEEDPPPGFDPLRLTTELSKLEQDGKRRQSRVAKSRQDAPPNSEWDTLFEQLDQRLDETSEVTFSQALALALERVNAARERWSGAYPFLVVDEAQDLSELQLELILALSSPERRPWFAGDHRQRIFGYQGATPQLRSLIEAAADGRYRELSLQQNYRHSSTLLDGVIRVNQSIDPDDQGHWIANRRNGDHFASAMTRTMVSAETAVETTCTAVSRQLDQGAEPRSIVVLTRTNEMSATLVVQLRRHGIAAFVPGGLEFDGVAGDLAAQLHPAPDNSRIREARVEWSRHRFGEQSLEDTLDAISQLAVRRATAPTLAVAQTEPADGSQAEQKAAEELYRIVFETPYLRRLRKQADPATRFIDLAQVVTALTVAEGTRSPRAPALHRLHVATLLEHYARTRPPTDGCSADQANAVRVMTLHQAKGMEFDHVVVLLSSSRHDAADATASWDDLGCALFVAASRGKQSTSIIVDKRATKLTKWLDRLPHDQLPTTAAEPSTTSPRVWQRPLRPLSIPRTVWDDDWCSGSVFIEGTLGRLNLTRDESLQFACRRYLNVLLEDPNAKPADAIPESWRTIIVERAKAMRESLGPAAPRRRPRSLKFDERIRANTPIAFVSNEADPPTAVIVSARDDNDESNRNVLGKAAALHAYFDGKSRPTVIAVSMTTGGRDPLTEHAIEKALASPEQLDQNNGLRSKRLRGLAEGDVALSTDERRCRTCRERVVCPKFQAREAESEPKRARRVA